MQKLLMKDFVWKSLVVFFTVSSLVLGVLGMTSCSDANVVSRNISSDADNFKVNRRIIFLNGITNDYLLVIEGLCSIGKSDVTNSITVVCKTGPDSYKKHAVGISDNVTYFSEHLDASNVSPYQYRVVVKALSLIPDLEIRK